MRFKCSYRNRCKSKIAFFLIVFGLIVSCKTGSKQEFSNAYIKDLIEEISQKDSANNELLMYAYIDDGKKSIVLYSRK